MKAAAYKISLAWLIAGATAPVFAGSFMYDNVDPKKVELGQKLFFDKVLSGNKNISCATCHHPLAGTGDAISLPAGEGASGTGATRRPGTIITGIRTRVPRNAPPIFNLGFREFKKLFHDGRVSVDPSAPGGFRTPAGSNTPNGLDNALAAQAMFPVTSGTEMAGSRRSNEQGRLAAAGNLPGVWAFVSDKVRAIPGYVNRFAAVYGISANQINIVHIANAIAAFEGVAWRADNSPYDRGSMSAAQNRGKNLFYGAAGCGSCHSGKFQTDHSFHAIAMPQIGPGKGHGVGHKEDFGLEGVTGSSRDRYKFRTPTLRNVALTGPYGHDGAYSSLKSMVKHHLAPVASLNSYDGSEAILPWRADLAAKDLQPARNPRIRRNIGSANELSDRSLTDAQINDVVSFLHALTDPASVDLRGDIPSSVPSGLPVAD